MTRDGEIAWGSGPAPATGSRCPSVAAPSGVRYTSTFGSRAPVAQLDRASAFEAAGRGFESLRARQPSPLCSRWRPRRHFCVCSACGSRRPSPSGRATNPSARACGRSEASPCKRSRRSLATNGRPRARRRARVRPNDRCIRTEIHRRSRSVPSVGALRPCRRCSTSCTRHRRWVRHQSGRFPPFMRSPSSAGGQQQADRLARQRVHDLAGVFVVDAGRRAPRQRGVYQIGDVNARSCVTIGTFGSIFTLKYAAS